MKKIRSLEIKEFSLSHNIKYWIVYDVFDLSEIETINLFFQEKIQYNKNKNLLENPLSVITDGEIPYFYYFASILKYITLNYNTLTRNIGYNYQDEYKTWVNSYECITEKKSKQSVFIPHIDNSVGIVGNYWLSKNLDTSGTQLFNYNGNILYYSNDIESKFTFDHNFNEDLFKPIIKYTKWYNINNSILKNNNLFYIGTAPCIFNAITIYNANVPHIPYIDENIKERNSISFLFK
jgi:hypothetical protein